MIAFVFRVARALGHAARALQRRCDETDPFFRPRANPRARLHALAPLYDSSLLYDEVVLYDESQTALEYVLVVRKSTPSVGEKRKRDEDSF